ncbi:MAG: disulfide oxidoreductase [Alphaproteobacteria bacterium]|nr:disulfide oxidoreductase [Alphaproteobacteria bacterium]
MSRRASGSLAPPPGGRVTAVLGPTNTGKTHFAIERLTAQRSGIIGLPLRLLAREVYDRIVRLKGAQAVALVTGEEKIVPSSAQYFVCTVEAMPLDLDVACLVVDEIQLCTDAERGHVFTDRLLFARGREETMFLGAETMRGVIQRFVPNAQFITRPRFSDLAFTGTKKLTRLPRRSAIIAFSAEDVYGIAELIRRQRGGAAVVLGALSPRTRNAQVALYQSGEVDFLVATDAIGMGLNMDIDHVAFSSLTKFDGSGLRALRADEIGQIAGRAGRHMNDGTFGLTADAESLEPEMIRRIENHQYEPVRLLQWRNSRLTYHSIDALLAALEAPAPQRGLIRARAAQDLTALRILASHADIRSMANTPAAVRLLWDACQIPDFRKLSDEDHVRLVGQIYRHLMSSEGVLPEDWFARQIGRLDTVEGDVATLSGRLAAIRIWTYTANRPNWLKDAPHWQSQTRAVEDRLSDALHERLTQRFIDRRTAILMRSLQDDDSTLGVDESGSVTVDGESVGKLEGFLFVPCDRERSFQGRTLRAAALKALDSEFARRERSLMSAPAEALNLSEHGRIWWDGAIVGQLAAGSSVLAPRLALMADDNLRPEMRVRLNEKLNQWLDDHLRARLDQLFALKNLSDARPEGPRVLPAAARGLAFQLFENLGALDREDVSLPAEELPIARALRPYGITFGRRSIYLPRLLRPDAAHLLALLWAISSGLKEIPRLPAAGITSFTDDNQLPAGFLAAAGFRRIGTRIVRLDIIERLEKALDDAAATGQSAQAALPRLVSLLGCDRTTLEGVLNALGWQQVEVAQSEPVWRLRNEGGSKARAPRGKRRRAAVQPGPPGGPQNSDSPFAGLRALLAAD